MSPMRLCTPLTILFVLALLILSGPAQAQAQAQTNITGPQSVRPGGTVNLQVVLATTAQVAGVQWTAGIPPAWGVTAIIGGAAAAAEKELHCAADSLLCLVVGLNANVIQPGVLATYSITVPTTAPRGSVNIPLTGLVAADPLGTPVEVTTGAGHTLLILAIHDLNGDGVTNMDDVRLMVDQILGRSPCTADQNGDGRCDLIDALLVVRGALGN